MGVHDQLGDQAAAYVLGALTPAEGQAFEAHLAECVLCTAEVRSLATVAGALAYLAPAAGPSAPVRARLVAAVSRRPASSMSWLALAASLALAAALGGYASQLRGRVSGRESRLREAVLAAPDLARIDLAGQPAAPGATARAFWSRSRGLVFTASNLPKPPPGRAYQLWVLTAAPAPISAGMLAPDADGRVTARFDTPPDLPRPVAMAVTLEPESGVPAPTGDKYLVGLAH